MFCKGTAGGSMPHAHDSNFMPPRQPVLLEPSLWGKEMSRRLLKHDILSALSFGSWEFYTRKQVNSRKTELSKDGTSLTQGGISQTLVRYTSPHVIFPPSYRNGNQLHGSHFSVNWRAGTTRVRNATTGCLHFLCLVIPLSDWGKLWEWGWPVPTLRSLELNI